jgi:adenylosuccinate lyase
VQRDIFLNISPLDARYYKSNGELIDELSCYLSENSVIKYEAAVETAMIIVMERYGIVPAGSGEEMKKAFRAVTPEEVYEEEAKTRHNIRALVNVMQRYVHDELAPYIHLSATSEDITGTAYAMRVRDAFYRVVVPKCIELLEVLVDIAIREVNTVQMGRTHGQHAVPVTVGYLFSGYSDRFGGRLMKVVEALRELRGKLSGAVGAYNASSLFLGDPRKFEEEVLGELGLRPANFSSQIVEPEYLLDLIHAVVSAFGVLANIADDMRHLQRTEIGEMGERFEKGQVGSSTMPHKRNPWNFEHVKSLWKEFVPRILTRYYDQISEHQRDLTNSASGRFVVEIITAFTLAVDRLLKQLKKLVIDHDNLKKNIKLTGGMFLAEPLYILLASKGFGEAHGIVKEATLRAEKEKKSVFEIIEQDETFSNIAKLDVWNALKENPESYTGRSSERTREITKFWKKQIKELESTCKAHSVVQYD